MSNILTFNHLLNYINIHGYNKAFKYFHNHVKPYPEFTREQITKAYDIFAKVCESYGELLLNNESEDNDNELNEISDHLKSYIQSRIDKVINYMEYGMLIIYNVDSIKPWIDKLNSLFTKNLIKNEHYDELIKHMIWIDATFNENHQCIKPTTFYKPQGEFKEVLKYIIDKCPDDFDQKNYIENSVNEINWLFGKKFKAYTFHYYDFDNE